MLGFKSILFLFLLLFLFDLFCLLWVTWSFFSIPFRFLYSVYKSVPLYNFVSGYCTFEYVTSQSTIINMIALQIECRSIHWIVGVLFPFCARVPIKWTSCSCQISPKWPLHYIIVLDAIVHLGRLYAWFINIAGYHEGKGVWSEVECRLQLQRPHEHYGTDNMLVQLHVSSIWPRTSFCQLRTHVKKQNKKSPRKIQLKRVILKISWKVTVVGWIVFSKCYVEV